MESRVGARPVFSIHFKPKIPFLLLPGFIASKPLNFRLSAIRRRNMRLTLTLNPSSSLGTHLRFFCISLSLAVILLYKAAVFNFASRFILQDPFRLRELSHG
jgi:hypothetical protein